MMITMTAITVYNPYLSVPRPGFFDSLNFQNRNRRPGNQNRESKIEFEKVGIGDREATRNQV